MRLRATDKHTQLTLQTKKKPAGCATGGLQLREVECA